MRPVEYSEVTEQADEDQIKEQEDRETLAERA